MRGSRGFDVSYSHVQRLHFCDLDFCRGERTRHCPIEVGRTSSDSADGAHDDSDADSAVSDWCTDDVRTPSCATTATGCYTPLTGGSVRGDRLPTPTGPSDSPSQSAQSTAGGGGRTLQDCMVFWDRGTHMTKNEWRAACQRSIHRLDNLKVDNLTLGQPKKIER